jgi:hypothetical protein
VERKKKLLTGERSLCRLARTLEVGRLGGSYVLMVIKEKTHCEKSKVGGARY